MAGQVASEESIQMCKSFVPLILAVSLSFCATSLATAQTLKDVELRIWKDQQGNEVTARLVRYKDGIVYLRSNLRKSFQVQPGQLSPDDRKYVVTMLQENQQPEAAEEFERLAKNSKTTENGTPGGFQGLSANPPGNGSDGFQGSNR